MSDDVRILLHEDDRGAFTVTASGRPKEFAPQVAHFRSADVVLGDGEEPDGAAEVLAFTMAAPSPLGTELLRRPHDVLLAFAYHVHDEAAMLAFDAGITEEYTRFYATRGVLYTGAFRVDGLGGGRLGEILAFDGVTSIEEAERAGNDDLPQRITDIDQECHALQDLQASRFVLWLQPRR